MLDFLFQKTAVKNAQKFIDNLEPKVYVHVPQDIPLVSIGLLKKMCVVVSKINGFEPEMSRLSDEQLSAKTEEFRQRYKDLIREGKENYEKLGEQSVKLTDSKEKEDFNLELEKAKEEYRRVKQEILKEFIPEAFAVVREAGKRILNMRHFDVQLIGGMVLNEGNIAEMTTGEGKTLVATLPAYLNAITRDGVHIVTVNDYLAKRDREWMGPIYQFLGLSIGVIHHGADHRERQQAYRCDITYGTNNEFGFDYLRDNMVNFKEEMVQTQHHFAIVDEVDSILIDEARTPLIISGPAEQSTDKYYRANQIAKELKGRRITERDEIDAKHRQEDLTVGYDYMADEKNKSISLTEPGEEKAAKMFGVDNMHDMNTIEYRHHILQALKAHQFFTIDVDYVVKDGQVIIVDEFTGRLMPGRRWSDGLHQAVEAKEGIKIERENQTLATITFQNYFRMYEKLSGMTGTANTEANEFKQIYNLEVTVIPTNKKVQRNNYPDAVYRSLKEKYKAIVDEIEECHKRGQPVLVGTISIEKSELLSRMLKQKGVTHNVLNAKYHEQEANIIAQAGRFKAVTIATNMAGRGTDIVLGGNAEFLARNLAEEKAKDAQEEEKEEMINKFIAQFRQQCQKEHVQVKELGGLYVLGTERHESRRIDNQLRGRQGRQGDPGTSKFFVSLEDDLMRLFASDRMVGLMDKLGMEEGQVLEHPWLTKAIENAQRRVEAHNFEIRKHLLEYDDVMNRQREVIYDMRRSVLESEDVKDVIVESVAGAVDSTMAQYLFSEQNEDWDIEGLDVYLKTTFDFELGAQKEKLKDMPQPEIKEWIVQGLNESYKKKEQEIGVERMRRMERMLLLHTIDGKWKDHLYGMDQLKEGISLRSFAQRDPLIEYKKEGFSMFEGMYGSIGQEVAEIIFKISPVEQGGPSKGVFSALPKKFVHDEASGLADISHGQPAMPRVNTSTHHTSSSPIQSDDPKVGRNDLCPCGSGKKYKKCCGR